MATILEEYYASRAHSFRVQEQRMLNLPETPIFMLYSTDKYGTIPAENVPNYLGQMRQIAVSSCSVPSKVHIFS
jgi:hypothetical protein